MSHKCTVCNVWYHSSSISQSPAFSWWRSEHDDDLLSNFLFFTKALFVDIAERNSTLHCNTALHVHFISRTQPWGIINIGALSTLGHYQPWGIINIDFLHGKSLHKDNCSLLTCTASNEMKESGFFFLRNTFECLLDVLFAKWTPCFICKTHAEVHVLWVKYLDTPLFFKEGQTRMPYFQIQAHSLARNDLQSTNDQRRLIAHHSIITNTGLNTRFDSIVYLNKLPSLTEHPCLSTQQWINFHSRPV